MRLRRARPAAVGAIVWRNAAPVQRAASMSDVADAPTWPTRFLWLALSAIPSSLMLGATTYISDDVASAPFLWVVPLALYLLTFVIAFQGEPLIPQERTHNWQGRVPFPWPRDCAFCIGQREAFPRIFSPIRAHSSSARSSAINALPPADLLRGISRVYLPFRWAASWAGCSNAFLAPHKSFRGSRNFRWCWRSQRWRDRGRRRVFTASSPLPLRGNLCSGSDRLCSRRHALPVCARRVRHRRRRRGGFRQRPDGTVRARDRRLLSGGRPLPAGRICGSPGGAQLLRRLSPDARIGSRAWRAASDVPRHDQPRRATASLEQGAAAPRPIMRMRRPSVRPSRAYCASHPRGAPAWSVLASEPSRPTHARPTACVFSKSIPRSNASRATGSISPICRIARKAASTSCWATRAGPWHGKARGLRHA